MKRGIVLGLVAGLAFVAFFIARLPAAWVVPAPPGPFACNAVEGTLWKADCTGLSIDGQAIGDLSWDIHALRLLKGKVAAHIFLRRPGASANGDVAIGFDRGVSLRDLVADIPLDPKLIDSLPKGVSGSIHADLTSAHILKNGAVSELVGRIDIHDLEDIDEKDADVLGDFQLVFRPGSAGPPKGFVQDQGGNGPLDVQGTLTLTPQPGYNLDVLVATRPSAPRDMAKAVEFLGSPDANGKRPLTVQGSY